MSIESMVVIMSPFDWFVDLNKHPQLGWIIYTRRTLASHEMPVLTVKYIVRPVCGDTECLV